MDQRNSMPTGSVEVPMEMLLQMIGEKEVTIRIQAQRIQAMSGEIQRMRAKPETDNANKIKIHQTD